MIALDRPFVAVDLEATSTNPQKARIIQVAAQRIVPASGGNGEFMNTKPGEELIRPNKTGIIRNTDTYSQIINPGVSVSDEILELTGITEDEIEQGARWPTVADELAEIIKDADLLGYNIGTYDYPLLEAEYGRLNREVPGPEDRYLIDAYALERELNPRTLENVFQRYTGESMEDAHNAASDVEATWRVFLQQLVTHGMKGYPLDWIYDRQLGDYLDPGRKLKETNDGVEICFGKHSGKTLKFVRRHNPSYIDWMWRKIPELRPHIDTALAPEK